MTANNTLLVPRIESRIQVIRGLRVMLDVDLAALYGVQTKRLNEQVKRNRDRFPSDFLFQLTADEKAEVVANCDHLQNLKFSKALPFAFTEHGAILAANVLASTNKGQVVKFADSFPSATIVSTLSAKSSRHMVQLVLPLTQFVATVSRQLSWSYFANLLTLKRLDKHGCQSGEEAPLA